MTTSLQSKLIFLYRPKSIPLLGLIFWIVLCQAAPVGLCDDATEIVTVEKDFWNEPNTNMAFIRMTADCFKMGNPVDRPWFTHEHPVHRVCLGTYYIGVKEVTTAQYHQFKPTHANGYFNAILLDDEQYPVVNVNLSDAIQFAKWLTQKNGGRYIFQLPTEAEWEYACREGRRTERYWVKKNNDSCLYANLMDHSPSKKAGQLFLNACLDNHIVVAPVGSYLPNNFGLFDMLGNVWEWCSDTYDIYAYKKLPHKNPVNLHDSEYQAIRGGSWQSNASDTRCSRRKYTVPNAKFEELGFRLVMTPLQ